MPSDILSAAELAEIAPRWDGTLTFEDYDRDPARYGVSVELAGRHIRALLASHGALTERVAALEGALQPFVRMWTATLVVYECLPRDMRAVPVRYIEAAWKAAPELDDNDD